MTAQPLTNDDQPEEDQATGSQPKRDQQKEDLSLLGIGHYDPSRKVISGLGQWETPRFRPGERVLMPPITEEEEEDPTGEDRGTPAVALGASRLGVLLDWLVNANYYLSQEDLAACYDCLDSIWRANPSRVKTRFRFKPSVVAQNRINDFQNYRFERYPIYEVWVNRYERVTNNSYFRRECLPYQLRKFYVQRGRFIAKETADEFIRAFFDAWEEEQYDLPVSNRWTLEKSIRAIQRFDEEDSGNDEEGNGTPRDGNVRSGKPASDVAAGPGGTRLE